MNYEITKKELLEGIEGGSSKGIDGTNAYGWVRADLIARVRNLNGVVFFCKGIPEDVETWEKLLADFEETERKALNEK
jgi:hypothetical protein